MVFRGRFACVIGNTRARFKGMSTTTIDSTDPKVHSTQMQKSIQELIDQLRQNIEKVPEPRFEALAETSAEVLIGLKTAFRDYSEGKERAFRR